jgi:hypothetical protein
MLLKKSSMRRVKLLMRGFLASDFAQSPRGWNSSRAPENLSIACARNDDVSSGMQNASPLSSDHYAICRTSGSLVLFSASKVNVASRSQQ